MNDHVGHDTNLYRKHLIEHTHSACRIYLFVVTNYFFMFDVLRWTHVSESRMSLNTVGSQIKYGLIKKGGDQSKAPLPSRLKASSLFTKDELDEVEDEAMDIRKQLVKRSIASEKAIDQYAANAMKDDPNIFDYDGAYDQMQSTKQNSMNKRFAAVSSEAPKSRYIGNLQAASQLREKEQERIFERKLIKERELEDTLYGDQPKYVTTAYKEKLLESKKWDYEDKMMEEVEKKHDVRSLGMQGFFSSLLTKNVAMGGDVKANAISAYTAGSERQEQVLEDRSKPGNNSSGSVENDNSHRHESEGAPSSSMKRPRSPSEEEHFPVSSLGNKHSVDQSSVAPPVPKMQRKEDAVLSARERYLARKKQTSMGPSGVEL